MMQLREHSNHYATQSYSGVNMLSQVENIIRQNLGYEKNYVYEI